MTDAISWCEEMRPISELTEYAKNPRKMTKSQAQHLQSNIEKFGLIDKPIINQNNTIIAGHQRIRLLKKMGYTEIPVMVPSRLLTDREVEELNYRHNENGGDFDYDILADQFNRVDLIAWGDDPLGQEKAEPKKGKPKAVFEFDTKEDMELALDMIEDAEREWGATLKIKV